MAQSTTYKGRKLDKDRAIYSLSKKGCIISDGRIKSIDLKHAKNIGNGSFGLIDFLSKFHGFLVNFKDYKIKI